MGHLAFYDMNADKYRPVDKNSQKPYFSLGAGWIVRRTLYIICQGRGSIIDIDRSSLLV
jgi:hypothetical protein